MDNENNKIEEKVYITPDEAAQILGVNKRQILRMIKAGKLQAKDINASEGKRHIWRILKVDVIKPDAYVSER